MGRTNIEVDDTLMLAELWKVVNDVIDFQASAGGGPVAQALIAGGIAGNHTVTGIAVGDTIISVIHNTAGALADLTGEFTIDSADTIDNVGGTDTSSDQLLVTYETPNSGTVPIKMSH